MDSHEREIGATPPEPAAELWADLQARMRRSSTW